MHRRSAGGPFGASGGVFQCKPGHVVALQMAHDDYEDRRERQRQGIKLAKAAGRYAGRKTNTAMHERSAALRAGGQQHRGNREAGRLQRKPSQTRGCLDPGEAGDKNTDTDLTGFYQPGG